MNNICCILILLGYHSMVSSQNSFFKNTSLNIGYAAYSPDTRLENLPDALIRSLQSDSYNTDKDFMIYLSKNIVYNRYFSFEVGLGYNLYRSNYSTWVNAKSFSNGGPIQYPIYRVENYYTKHNLVIPVKLGKSIFSFTPNIQLDAGVNVLPIFTFYKKVFPFSKFTFDINNAELNPFITFQLKNVAFTAAYRVINIVKTDDALYSTNNPGLVGRVQLFNKYDTYNPTKWWFTVGYDLSSRYKLK